MANQILGLDELQGAPIPFDIDTTRIWIKYEPLLRHFRLNGDPYAYAWIAGIIKHDCIVNGKERINLKFFNYTDNAIDVGRYYILPVAWYNYYNCVVYDYTHPRIMWTGGTRGLGNIFRVKCGIPP